VSVLFARRAVNLNRFPVAKHHQLDIAVQTAGGASDKLDKAAQQQVPEREERGPNLPGEGGRSYELAG